MYVLHQKFRLPPEVKKPKAMSLLCLSLTHQKVQSPIVLSWDSGRVSLQDKKRTEHIKLEVLETLTVTEICFLSSALFNIFSFC